MLKIVGQVFWGLRNKRRKWFREPLLYPQLWKRGKGAGHPLFSLMFRIPVRDILCCRVIAVYFTDTGLKVSVCYEFLFELYFCKNTISETPRKLWPCLFATFSLTRHDDVMRRWSPDVDSNSPDVGRRSQGLGCGQVLLAASRWWRGARRPMAAWPIWHCCTCVCVVCLCVLCVCECVW